MRSRVRICVIVVITLAAIGILRAFSLRSNSAPVTTASVSRASAKQITVSVNSTSSLESKTGDSSTRDSAEENAADIYKNAFVLFNALTDEEKHILSHPRDEVDAAKAAALFEKIQPIMALLRQAKDAAYCDWAMGPPSFEKPFSHMNLAQELGRIARWDAAYRFSTANDPAGAVDDLTVQAQLGRSVGGEALIGFLVEAGLNAGAIDLIRDNAGKLSPDVLSQVMEMFSRSDGSENLSRAMTTETAMLRSWAQTLLNPQTREMTLNALVGFSENADPNTRQLLEKQMQSFPAQVEWLARTENDFAQKALLPDAEFNPWWAQVSEQAQSQLLAKFALPALTPIRDRLRFANVNQAMITAGLAILKEGAEQLATRPDPTTGKPFAYIPTPTGFELRSTFQYKKKPVIMSFPSPAQ